MNNIWGLGQVFVDVICQTLFLPMTVTGWSHQKTNSWFCNFYECGNILHLPLQFQTLLFNSMPSTPFGKFNLIGRCKNIHHSCHESRVLVLWILYIVLFFCAKCVWTMTAPSLTGAIWKDGLSCEEEQKTQCVVPLAYSPSDVHKNLSFFFSAHTVILYSNCTINLWGKVDSQEQRISVSDDEGTVASK